MIQVIVHWLVVHARLVLALAVVLVPLLILVGRPFQWGSPAPRARRGDDEDEDEGWQTDQFQAAPGSRRRLDPSSGFIEFGRASQVTGFIGTPPGRLTASAPRWSLFPPRRPRPRAAKSQIVNIFYGTDRAPQSAGRRSYSGERGERLRVGEARVSVPASRKPGSVRRPLKVFKITLEREDPSKHFVIQGVSEHSVGTFSRRLRRAARAQADASALLFVHGYNTDFDGALYRAAQLAVDLEVAGPMLLYSWPSRGRVDAYDYDGDSTMQARAYFRQFLDLVAASSVTRLNIVAHSKGNELVLEALTQHPLASLTGVHQVVLASPDVDSSGAPQLIAAVSPKVRGMTLYACAEDLALRASQGKAGGVARVGGLLADGFPLIAAGMDSIDASACDLRLAEFNHNNYVADTVLRYDLQRLLQTGVRPPGARTPSITRQTCPRGQYWRLQPR